MVLGGVGEGGGGGRGEVARGRGGAGKEHGCLGGWGMRGVRGVDS